uniref:Uncharacterized protein n=1 Tax=viral metagenome TaxID=1070528 RepID=A0A6M3JSG0_9ZZZZ
MQIEKSDFNNELCNALAIPPEGVKEINIHYCFCDIVRVEIIREIPLDKDAHSRLIRMFEDYEINPRLVRKIVNET